MAPAPAPSPLRSRLSVISDEVSQDLSTVAAFVREFGLTGIELRSARGRAFKDLTDDDVAEIARIARGEGWKIHGVSTPVFKCECYDETAIREHWEIFKRSLEVARRLDAPLLRVFTFLRRPTGLTVDDAKRIADHLLPLSEAARAAGMRLGIENESSCQVGTPGELALLMDQLTHPAAGVIWDPCNVLYVPGVGQVDLAAAFRSLAPRIIHIHVKDAKRAQPAPEAAVVGEGSVDWSSQMRAIRESGYNGLLSLETHWRKTALDTKLLHLPAGEAFSAGGLEASRICLQRLIELCDAG